MKPIQMVARDLFGGVVFNQIFPNLPIAVTSISLFISMWGGPISQVIIISSKPGNKFSKTVFKIQSDDVGTLYLQSAKGERILLPTPPSEEHYEGEIDDDDWDDDDLEALG